MNGIDRVYLKELPNGLENELMRPPEFNIPCAAFNYLYRPRDEAVLAKNPHLRFLPTEEEAKGQ
jgi:hypothetical protein